jgi:hypothetical protein
MQRRLVRHGVHPSSATADPNVNPHGPSHADRIADE